MNKMKEHISKEEILNLPVTTNRLVVAWNKEAFFAKYAIVSYKMDTRDYKRKKPFLRTALGNPFFISCGYICKV